MDSLYEPAPEQQEAKDTTAPESQATTPVGTHADCGPPDRSMSLVSNINCKTCNTFWKKKPTIALYVGTCVFCWLIFQFELFRLCRATVQISSLEPMT